jgi:hypothetical protein
MLNLDSRRRIDFAAQSVLQERSLYTPLRKRFRVLESSFCLVSRIHGCVLAREVDLSRTAEDLQQGSESG